MHFVLSYLREYKFKHNIQDGLYPSYTCSHKTTTFYLLHCPSYTNKRITLLDKMRNINSSTLEQSDTIITNDILFKIYIPWWNFEYSYFNYNNWLSFFWLRFDGFIFLVKVWWFHFFGFIFLVKVWWFHFSSIARHDQAFMAWSI